MHRWPAWGRTHDTAREFFHDLLYADGDFDDGDAHDFFFFLGHGMDMEEEPEDLRREPSPRERELRNTPLPKDCALLAPWFRVLSSSLLPYKVGVDQRDSQDVRVGRDETDLWIQATTYVNLLERDRVADVRRTPDSDARLLREALYLTSLLAEIDHGAWLGEILRTNDVGFLVPMDLDLNACELPRQFEMSIVDDESANRIHKLFTDNTPLTVDFRRAFAKLCGAAKVRGLENFRRHYRVPVRLVVTAAQSATLTLVVRLLTKVLEIVRGTRDPSTFGLIGPSMLWLESADLCLGNVTLDPSFLAVLEKLILTGVRIRTLVLPRFPASDIAVQDPEELLFYQSETRLAWSSFVRTLLLSSAGIDTLQINLRDMGVDFVAPFFSALAHTRGVRRLVCSYKLTNGSSNVSMWLAFALFSRKSTNAITSLALLDVNLTDGVFVDFVDAFSRAQDPFGVLWGLIGDDSDPLLSKSAARGTEVHVNKGTVVSVLGMTQGSIATMRLLWDVSGVVVKDDEVTETFTLLIDGIGFCRVKKSSLSSKKRRVERQTDEIVLQACRPRACVVHTLMIDVAESGAQLVRRPQEGRRQACHELTRLIRLLGRSLKALSVNANCIDDTLLQDVARHCKRIQSLRIARANLRSMAPLVEMCRGRSSLSSLDLYDVNVPIRYFESFLGSLRVTTPAASSLRRLRFGGGGMCHSYRQQTGDMMRAVLHENKLLTHVHIFAFEHMPSYIHFDRRSHRAETLPSTPLPLASRVALLSIPNPCFASLDRAILTGIFEWAAPAPTWRRITVDPDVPRSLR